MRITIQDSVLQHFWEDSPIEGQEFWAFRFPPKAHIGDPIYFINHGKVIAEAIVDRIERPGQSQCDITGKYKNRWKVFWKDDTFKKVE